MSHNEISTAPTDPPSPRRRRILLGTGALLALSAVPLPKAWAAPSEDPILADFLSWSRYLTGRSELDPELGRRVLTALSSRIADFIDGARALARYIQDHRETPADELSSLMAEQEPRLAALTQQILSGWYLGQVGGIASNGGEREGRSSAESVDSPAVVVAYEHALMFDPVRDVLTIPSYCRDLPGYWAQRPA